MTRVLRSALGDGRDALLRSRPAHRPTLAAAPRHAMPSPPARPPTALLGTAPRALFGPRTDHPPSHPCTHPLRLRLARPGRINERRHGRSLSGAAGGPWLRRRVRCTKKMIDPSSLSFAHRSTIPHPISDRSDSELYSCESASSRR